MQMNESSFQDNPNHLQINK